MNEFGNIDFAFPIADTESNSAAFKLLFRQYYSALCYFSDRIIANSSDAEDVVEEVFTKLWNSKQTFSDMNHLHSFLYKATRNASLDHLKKTRHAKERQMIFAEELDISETSYLNEMIRTEVLREIYCKIKGLPEQCARIVSMSYIEGKKNSEIADELGISLQTVKNQKSRGISLLKVRLSYDLFMLFILLSSASR